MDWHGIRTGALVLIYVRPMTDMFQVLYIFFISYMLAYIEGVLVGAMLVQNSPGPPHNIHLTLACHDQLYHTRRLGVDA